MAVDYQYLKPSLGLTDYPTTVNTLIDLLQAADQEVETARGVELTLNARFDTIESSITIGTPILNNLVAMDASGSLIDSGFLASQFIRSDNVSDTAAGSITFSNSIDLTGVFNIDSTAVTSTAAELNYLDISVLGTGVSSKAIVLDSNSDYTWPATGILTYGVLNDGTTSLTASVVELNTMQGISATTAELNILDNVTATSTELNYLDISTLGTAQSSKAVTLDASGILNFNNLVIDNPSFKSYEEQINVLGSIGTTLTLNINTANVHTATATAGITTVTLTGPTTGRRGTLTIEITNTTFAITWPASVKWAAGVTPPNSNAASGIDIYTLTTIDAGTTWFGFQIGYNMS